MPVHNEGLSSGGVARECVSDDLTAIGDSRYASNTPNVKEQNATTVDLGFQDGSSSAGTHHPPPHSQKAGWFHWHEPGTSAAEKKLIFKLDWFLLSFSCLYFFVKQLDQNNLSNAYVSGMKEDLNFGPGNELSWMNTYFLIGTIIGGPFANLIITIIRPRIWLPSCLIIWSLFVLFMFKTTTAGQFYALRFCIGLFESAAWPGIQYVLGCWYRKSELARRSALFVVSGVLGQMFSGYLQAALFSGMQGKSGMPAWRWLFIFDFLLAIPVALYGYFFFPDTPHTTQAFYLNDWERNRACERIEEEGRAPKGKLDRTIIKRIAGSWQVYVFSLAYSFWTLTCGSYIIQYFGIWLKSRKVYSVPEINNIPTSVGAVNFFFMIVTGYVSDKIGRRGPVCFAIGLLLTFCYSILTAWNVPNGLKMAVFIMIARLKIGTSKRVFKIHEDLLCERSPFFRCYLQPKRKEIQGDCPICIDELKSGVKELTYCTTCGGNFHSECIENLRKHSSLPLRCPLCRRSCSNHFRSPGDSSKSFPEIHAADFATYNEWLYSGTIGCDSVHEEDFKPLVSAYLFSLEVEDRKFGTAILQAMLEVYKDDGLYPEQDAIALAYDMEVSFGQRAGLRRLRTFLIDTYLAAAKSTWFEDEDWHKYPPEFLRDFAVAMLMQHPRKNKWNIDTWKAKLEVEEEDEDEEEEGEEEEETSDVEDLDTDTDE
ncbi:hypothetical protein SLS60_006651 [Paraconiothyrium brasiliense]|uniref:RING-type domain-containing protein n=1 Tax=Paraconiothyrium brasiliense TaxID=300254 RepID=A0ABR3RBB4_9PLEO